MFGDTDKLKREGELVERFENFVPEEVSPYMENPDRVQYYYKSIGGEVYFTQSWDIEETPSYATLTGNDYEDTNITEYFSYDEIVHTFIISEELLKNLDSEVYCVKVHYEDETEDIMKTLPVNTELNIGLYFCFDYDRKSWCGENVTFKVIP